MIHPSHRSRLNTHGRRPPDSPLPTGITTPIATLLQGGIDTRVYPGAVWAVGDPPGLPNPSPDKNPARQVRSRGQVVSG